MTRNPGNPAPPRGRPAARPTGPLRLELALQGGGRTWRLYLGLAGPPAGSAGNRDRRPQRCQRRGDECGPGGAWPDTRRPGRGETRALAVLEGRRPRGPVAARRGCRLPDAGPSMRSRSSALPGPIISSSPKTIRMRRTGRLVFSSITLLSWTAPSGGKGNHPKANARSHRQGELNGRLAPGRASQRSRSASRQWPSHAAAGPIPRQPLPETPGYTRRRVGKSRTRPSQNRPSRNRSASSLRSRGRRAAASSIWRWTSLAFSEVSRRSAKRPARSPERRSESRNRSRARMMAP